MASFSIFHLSIALFVLTLVLGFWMSKRGKPYPGILFNAHKLTALVGVVFAVLVATRTWKVSPGFSILLTGIILAVIGVLLLFVSGALLSANRLQFSLMLLSHRLSLAPLFLGLGWLIVVVTA